MEKKGENSKKTSNKYLSFIAIILIVILFIFFVTNFISNKNNNKDIKSVKRVLKSDYSYLECIDSYCNGFVAIKGDKLKEYTVELYNVDGKKVASYKEKYNSKSKSSKTPYQLTDNYFIMRTINNDDSNDVKFSIVNSKGKDMYQTSNPLKVINKNFISMEDSETGEYSILDKKGTELYNTISSIDTYMDGKYIEFKIDDTYTIINEDGERVLNNYKVAKTIEDNSSNVLYFIVKDVKNNMYYYFDIDKNEVVGDGFISYKKADKSGEFIITKVLNDKRENYLLKSDGKQTKYEEKLSDSDIVLQVKEKVDSNSYYLYENSISKKDQKNVLVDNKNDKSFGVLNLDTNKYTKIYSYDLNNSYYYSTVDKLNDSNSDLYLKIYCSKNNCSTPRTIIYDFEHMKEIYKIEDSNLVVSDYIQYENGYKVIRYSTSSSDTEYKGKYVLYDSNGKELLKTSDRPIVIDQKLIFGNEYDYSLALYSSKENKVISKEDASIITIANKKLYKYKDEDGNVVICNLSGKKLVTSKSDYLKYSSSNIVYLDDNIVNIYDVKKDKVRKYKLKSNEKINDGSGEIIPPYRGAIFINNSSDKYIKVINSKAKVVKKIKNAEINTVEINEKNNNIFIIVKENSKTGNLYGLYIAK